MVDEHHVNVCHLLIIKKHFHKLQIVVVQKRHGLSSVSEMKDFVANDLKTLKQQHRSLALRMYSFEVTFDRVTTTVLSVHLFNSQLRLLYKLVPECQAVLQQQHQMIEMLVAPTTVVRCNKADVRSRPACHDRST